MELHSQVEERGGKSAEVAMLPLDEKTKRQWHQAPEYTVWNQSMTLGQAFFLCEDEVEDTHQEEYRRRWRRLASQGLYKYAQGQVRPLVRSREASGDKAVTMSPHD